MLFTGMVKNKMAETKFEQALSTVCSTFEIALLNAYQLTAIKDFVIVVLMPFVVATYPTVLELVGVE